MRGSLHVNVASLGVSCKRLPGPIPILWPSSCAGLPSLHFYWPSGDPKVQRHQPLAAAFCGEALSHRLGAFGIPWSGAATPRFWPAGHSIQVCLGAVSFVVWSRMLPEQLPSDNKQALFFLSWLNLLFAPDRCGAGHRRSKPIQWTSYVDTSNEISERE